jgi:hypothetical protein
MSTRVSELLASEEAGVTKLAVDEVTFGGLMRKAHM